MHPGRQKSDVIQIFRYDERKRVGSRGYPRDLLTQPPRPHISICTRVSGLDVQNAAGVSG